MNKVAISLLALTALTPQDEYFNQQWYLKNNGYNIRRDITEISSYAVMGKPGADIHFPFDLAIQTGPRKPVVVAILDTGVDIDHAEIHDAILRSSECDSLGHLPPVSAPDKDGNGFAGDCAGWDFASNKSIAGDNQVYDDTGHGTHLSGIIAAKADSVGIRGISDQIKILPVKIFNKYEIPNHPLRPKAPMMDRIQNGLKYAIDKNVDIINLSLGWPSVLDSPKIRALFDLAAKKNILIVAAAGNNSQHTTIFPCSYASVVCVGATTVDGTVAPFSNYGGNVDVMAPGENILSTIPKKITSLYFDQDGYDFKNGTSQAAPMVAGSAALMKIVLGDIPVSELKARLFSAASRSNDSLSSLYGDINLTNAIANKPDQFVYPALKELNTVEVGYPGGQFTMDLPFDKYLPGAVSNGKVSLSLGDVTLDQHDFDLSFADQDSEKVVHVTGRVPDFKLSSTQVLSVSLSYGSHQYSFQKELTFALNAEQVGTQVSFQEKINPDTLKSVDDTLRLSDQTLFYATDTSGNTQSLSFFAVNGSQMKKTFVATKGADVRLLTAVFVKKNQVAIEFYDAANSKLIYDFWDTDKGALVKSLTMVPDSAVFTLNQATYFESLLGLPSLRAVAFANGKIPPSEANKDVFLNSQTGASDHIYYFEENGGKITTGLLDTLTLRNSLIQQYQLRYDDGISPIAVLTQGSSPTVDTLFVVGKGYDRRVLAIQFTGHDQFKVTREYLVPGGAALKAISFLGKTMILTQERTDAYLMFDLDTAKFSTYEWKDLNDTLMNPIVTVANGQLLAETTNHIVVLGNQGQASTVALKRFSFLPGELFSDMYTPVQVKTNAGMLPGLFIDGTLISDKHIGLVTWDGSKIVKSINFQEKLPDNCHVMNPQRIDGVYQMVLFCQSDAQGQYLLKRGLSQ